MQFANFVDPMGAELDHGLSASDGSYSTEWSEGDDERFAENEMASLSTMVAASPSVRSPAEAEAPESATVHSPVSSTAHSGVSEVSTRFPWTWWHAAFLYKLPADLPCLTVDCCRNIVKSMFLFFALRVVPVYCVFYMVAV